MIAKWLASYSTILPRAAGVLMLSLVACGGGTKGEGGSTSGNNVTASGDGNSLPASGAGGGSGGSAGSGTVASGAAAPGSGASAGVVTGTSGASGASGAGGTGTTAVSGSSGTAMNATGSASGAATSGAAAGAASGTAATGGASAPDGGGATTGAGGTPFDAGAAKPSAGCGMAPGQSLMTFVEYKEMVTVPGNFSALWNNRDYFVWLPSNYDPTRPYTTVFLGPGCGGNSTVVNGVVMPPAVVPVQKASTTNAIIIALDPDPPAEGRSCFNTESPMTPEIAYFDATLAQVEAKFCIDTSRLFIAGFSSGSWLADTLGCVRANVLRGQGNTAGELQGGLTCTGPIAAMMVHDTGDPANNYMQDYNGARAGIAMRNGCSTQTMPYSPGPPLGANDLMGKPIQCVQYVGCKAGYPLVWCPTTGYGHNDGTGSGLTTYGWWNFWEMLP